MFPCACGDAGAKRLTLSDLIRNSNVNVETDAGMARATIGEKDATTALLFAR